MASNSDRAICLFITVTGLLLVRVSSFSLQVRLEIFIVTIIILDFLLAILCVNGALISLHFPSMKNINHQLLLSIYISIKGELTQFEKQKIHRKTIN